MRGGGDRQHEPAGAVRLRAAGGRVFASHFHYAWFNTGPFSTKNLATWLPNDNGIGNINANVVTTAWDGTPFVRGQAFHDWLLNVGALSNDALAHPGGPAQRRRDAR